jgi:hypothetical protein
MSSQAHPAPPAPAPDEAAIPDVVGLITVCAWCGRPMGRGLSSRRIISHGICRSCSDDVLFSDTLDAVTRR